MTRKAVQTFLIVGLSAVLAWAQSTAPRPVQGELPSLRLGSEAEPGNMIMGAINVGAFYDDNILARNKQTESDVAYVVRPRLEFSRATSRLHWLLAASPGFTKHQQFAERDQFTGNADTDLQYQLMQHLQFRFRDSFLRTDDPEFDVFNRPTTELGLLDHTNASVIVPLGKRVSNISNVQLSYLMGPRSMLEVIGNYHFQHFSPIPQVIAGNESTAQLVDSEGAGARAAYAYRLSQRHTVGLMYSFQDLAFFRGQSARAVTHAIFYTHAFTITSKMSLELFAGPERSHTFNQVALGLDLFTIFLPINKDTWSWAGGSTFGWQGNHTSLRASFVRQVGEGGGLLSAVRHQGETLEVRHQFTRRWIGDVHAAYGENSLLSVFSNAASIRSFVAGAGATREITQNFSLRLGYTRAQQNRRGRLLGGEFNTDRDRVSVSLEYKFKHPLGR